MQLGYAATAPVVPVPRPQLVPETLTLTVPRLLPLIVVPTKRVAMPWPVAGAVYVKEIGEPVDAIWVAGDTVPPFVAVK